MMRRPFTLILTALLVGAGCSDGISGTAAEVGSDPGEAPEATSVESTTTTVTTVTTSSTTTTTTTTTTTPPVIQSEVEAIYTPAPTATGDLLVHDRSSVFVVDPTADAIEPQVVLGPLDGLVVAAARLAADGSLVVELLDDVATGEPITVHKIVHFGVDGSIVDLIDDAVLFDVATFGGVEQALVGMVPPDGDVDEGDLVAVPLDGRPPVAFGTAFAPEYGVDSIDVVGEVAIVSAYSDLTEVVSFTDAEGHEIAGPSPTDGLAYGAEPAVGHATFSPDGSEIAWIEGPELYYDVDADEATWHGAWRVRSFDAVTGEERLSWPFDFPDTDRFTQLISGLAYSGDRLFISRAMGEDGRVSDIELLVLDLTTEEPETYELPVIGVADVVG